MLAYYRRITVTVIRIYRNVVQDNAMNMLVQFDMVQCITR